MNFNSKWKVGRGDASQGTLVKDSTEYSLEEAYYLAEKWLRKFKIRVIIYVLTPTNFDWCVADTREPGTKWVVGKERYEDKRRK